VRLTGELVLLSSGPAMSVAAWKGLMPDRSRSATCKHKNQNNALTAVNALRSQKKTIQKEAWKGLMLDRSRPATCKQKSANAFFSTQKEETN
jgi:hypothetical protein